MDHKTPDRGRIGARGGAVKGAGQSWRAALRFALFMKDESAIHDSACRYFADQGRACDMPNGRSAYLGFRKVPLATAENWEAGEAPALPPQR